MDIKPTMVDVKDILIIDDSNYGENIIIQVIGREDATAPLSVPYSVLSEFAQKVLSIKPGQVEPVEPADDFQLPEDVGSRP